MISHEQQQGCGGNRLNPVLFGFGNLDWLFYTSGLLSLGSLFKIPGFKKPNLAFVLYPSSVRNECNSLVSTYFRAESSTKALKQKIMSTDHRISTANGRFHKLISLSSTQSPLRGQVSSVHRNFMDQKMPREGATLSWNFRWTAQGW